MNSLHYRTVPELPKHPRTYQYDEWEDYDGDYYDDYWDYHDDYSFVITYSDKIRVFETDSISFYEEVTLDKEYDLKDVMDEVTIYRNRYDNRPVEINVSAVSEIKKLYPELYI